MLEHPVFRRQGQDIYIDMPVAPWEAMLGAKIEIPSLDGQAVVTVPPGHFQRHAAADERQGHRPPQTRQRGDQYAVVKIVVPKKLSQHGAELAGELARSDPFNPREGIW